MIELSNAPINSQVEEEESGRRVRKKEGEEKRRRKVKTGQRVSGGRGWAE